LSQPLFSNHRQRFHAIGIGTRLLDLGQGQAKWAG
jgi:hypothetical protein